MDDQLTFEQDPECFRFRKALEKAVEAVGDTMPEAQLARFLKPLELRGRESHICYVTAPGEFVATWVRDKYLTQLESALSEELGEPVQICLEARLHEPPADRRLPVQLQPPSSDMSAIARYTFDNFVVGPSNRIAHDGAKAVADRPGGYCNPLFIYGKTGLGKTHLLWAIANRLRAAKQRRAIRCMTAQQFVEEFVTALRSGSIRRFRRSVESVSVWLVDDIDFLEEKRKTQEELFHLFNHLYESGKQLVFSCDRPPRELAGMPMRLRSRLESGLVADIQPPDTETRAEIVSMKAAKEGVELPAEVCESLAASVPDNVRTLEGILTTLLAHVSLGRRDPSLELVDEIIQAHFGTPEPCRPHADQIIARTASYFHLTDEEIRGPSRKAGLTRPRHIAVYLCREYAGESWKRLGERFGNRDHTSIMHGHRKIRGLLKEDPELLRDVRRLMDDLNLEN
ncbi:MAG: chromosomal replication initiator protein DnaA [Armatimonadetes bacterium]|nr:chromosomal replication initiator protein DnaA [Armatimonadota bacterium]